MNQEQIYRRSRMRKVAICFCCFLLVSGSMGYLIVSREMVRQRLDQSVEQMQKDDRALSEKLSEGRTENEERTADSKPSDGQTVSQ
jgi:hypothetical protein